MVHQVSNLSRLTHISYNSLINMLFLLLNPAYTLYISPRHNMRYVMYYVSEPCDSKNCCSRCGEACRLTLWNPPTRTGRAQHNFLDYLYFCVFVYKPTFSDSKDCASGVVKQLSNDIVVLSDTSGRAQHNLFCHFNHGYKSNTQFLALFILVAHLKSSFT